MSILQCVKGNTLFKNDLDFVTSYIGRFAVPGLKIRVRTRKLLFLLLNQNICLSGYSKEPSPWDGSFEHPKHTFKLMDKKIITILRKMCLTGPMLFHTKSRCILAMLLKISWHIVGIEHSFSLTNIRHVASRCWIPWIMFDGYDCINSNFAKKNGNNCDGIWLKH